jgi:hypothetical protein
MQVIFGVVLAMAFFSGVAFLFAFQVRMVFYNITTIEYLEKWDDDLTKECDGPYYLSPTANFQQLFGGPEVWHLWLLPIRSNQRMGNGTVFPVKSE